MRILSVFALRARPQVSYGGQRGRDRGSRGVEGGHLYLLEHRHHAGGRGLVDGRAVEAGAIQREDGLLIDGSGLLARGTGGRAGEGIIGRSDGAFGDVVVPQPITLCCRRDAPRPQCGNTSAVGPE